MNDFFRINLIYSDKKGVVELSSIAPKNPNRAQQKHTSEINAKRTDPAIRTLARILNENYVAGKDVMLTLTLSEEGLSKLETMDPAKTDNIEDATLLALDHEARKYIKRIRNSRKGLKYVCVPSDRAQDPEGEMVPARPHIHFIIEREYVEPARQKWKLGEVYKSVLYDEDGDFHRLAQYLIEQTRMIGKRQRYPHSRNMSKPYELSFWVPRDVASQLRVPDGCTELYTSDSFLCGVKQSRYRTNFNQTSRNESQQTLFEQLAKALPSQLLDYIEKLWD